MGWPMECTDLRARTSRPPTRSLWRTGPTAAAVAAADPSPHTSQQTIMSYWVAAGGRRPSTAWEPQQAAARSGQQLRCESVSRLHCMQLICSCDMDPAAPALSSTPAVGMSAKAVTSATLPAKTCRVDKPVHRRGL